MMVMKIIERICIAVISVPSRIVSGLKMSFAEEGDRQRYLDGAHQLAPVQPPELLGVAQLFEDQEKRHRDQAADEQHDRRNQTGPCRPPRKTPAV